MSSTRLLCPAWPLLGVFLKGCPALCCLLSEDNPTQHPRLSPEGSLIDSRGTTKVGCLLSHIHSLLGTAAPCCPRHQCQDLWFFPPPGRAGPAPGRAPPAQPSSQPQYRPGLSCAHRHEPSLGLEPHQWSNEVCHFTELSCSHSCSNKQTP